jgi:hypothetical protein
MMRKHGRKLDEGKKREVLAILTVGCSREAAARYVGCSPQTIRREIERDGQFAAEVARSEQQAEVYFVKSIRQAAQKEQYWRAAAWFLEHRRPEQFGKRSGDTVTRHQVNRILGQLAEIVIEEVSSVDCRKQILTRLQLLLDGLNSTSSVEEAPQTLAAGRGGNETETEEAS